MTRDELDLLTDSFSDIEIAEIKKVTRGMVGNWRKKFDVPSYTTKTGNVRRGGVSRPANRDCSGYGRPIKSDGYVTFFDNIDTPAKAYFLGFIAADGNLDLRGRTIRIQIHRQDRAILQTFIDESGWKGRISEINSWGNVNRQPQVCLCLSSAYAHSALCSWGVTAKKSLTLEILKPISKDLQNHFVRGVWDGDGYVSERQFGLTSGSKTFIKQVQSIVEEHSGVQLKLRERGENHFAIYGGKKDYLAVRWIYQSSYPVLERKAIQFSRFWSPSTEALVGASSDLEYSA